MLPSTFVNLPREEKAFVIACIDERIAAEKRAMQKPRKR
jgi:carbonic anhydrase